ncbi:MULTISPECIES: secretin N-terminal domain-containing protein [Burkholderia cepacia complex]|uniref:secretin N-terminal domain-containing protein n=1 Tax=Burkholderia cepacia complex TaxID=87882 RepID=UPI002012E9E4|nr:MULTISPECIES: secretin N-terminal domain-containing protein [Burkholderia cepacia complex]MCO1366467.1 secretin [Burkholderia multivorans]MCO1376076.1 secretin [Burkholderia multivorans]UQP21090.1 secretin [Burkholderia multivorans]UQP89059.1 secretin [Burkholderia multivorans]
MSTLLLALLGSACTSLKGTLGGTDNDAVKQSNALMKSGQPEQAIDVLDAAHKARPDDAEVNVALQGRRTTYVNDELRAAGSAWALGDTEGAFEHLGNARRADPSSQRVRQAVARLQRRMQLGNELAQAERVRQNAPDRALEIVGHVLDEQPDFADAIQLRDSLLQQQRREHPVQPRLADALRKPVSLNFRSQPLENIFDAISRTSGVNFVFDQDVQTSAPSSLFASSTTAEKAINLLLRTNQLEKKVLDEHTLLIYPARAEKGRAYKEYMMRTFFLSNADAKNVVSALRQMVKPKDVYVDERTNAVIVRDTPESIKVAERIVQALDLPQSEVTMDVQVLEVNSDETVDFGVQYPQELGFAIEHPYERVHTTIGDLLSLNRNNIAVSGDGGAKLRMAIRMLQTQGKTKILANPKVRVRNNEKADITVGERVPIVTTTTNNGVTSESISYQDVGLQLVVQPRISLNNEVSVQVKLEVSNILAQVTTKTGLIAYRLGTRKAETLMTAGDNQTQVLAGLIDQKETSATSGLPYFSRLPGVGRAFGTDKSEGGRAEIVLLITPHIERNLDLPASAVTTFMSGTEGEVTTEPMTFGRPATADVPAAAPAAAPKGGPALSDPVGRFDAGATAHPAELDRNPAGPGTRITPADGGTAEPAPAGGADKAAPDTGDAKGKGVAKTSSIQGHATTHGAVKKVAVGLPLQPVAGPARRAPAPLM